MVPVSVSQKHSVVFASGSMVIADGFHYDAKSSYYVRQCAIQRGIQKIGAGAVLSYLHLLVQYVSNEDTKKALWRDILCIGAIGSTNSFSVSLIKPYQ